MLSLDKYVITTKRFTDRHKSFAENNSHIPNYVWRYGPDSNDFHEKKTIYTEFIDKISINNDWLPSILCNAISHMSLIEECAKGNEIMTIIEDDAVLVKDFDVKATKLIDTLPGRSFDFIQWGWNWDTFVFIRDKSGQVSKVDWSAKYLKIDPLDFRESETNSELLPLLLSWGINCYSITPKGAQKLLDFFPVIEDIWVNSFELTGITYRAATIDGAFNSFYPKMEAYIAVEPLSYVTNDKADSVLSSKNYN